MYSHPFSRARELLLEDDRAIQNKKERELSELHRLRSSAHNLRQIGVNNYSAAALRKSIQVAKRADAIEETLPETHVEARRDVRLATRSTHAKRIMGIRDFVVRRPDGVCLFHIGRLDIGRGERIALLGKNGTGKTRLVLSIRDAFGNLEDGRAKGFEIAPSVVMGYMDQLMSQLPDQDTLHAYIAGTIATGNQRAVASLVAAGFPVHEHSTRIHQLSPGQRARLALLALRLLEPSFFLLDEPTNHLDIAGQEQLESEILDHDATAILISHDRSFVERSATRFLVVENTELIEVRSPETFYRALFEDVTVLRLAKDARVL